MNPLKTTLLLLLLMMMVVMMTVMMLAAGDWANQVIHPSADITKVRSRAHTVRHSCAAALRCGSKRAVIAVAWTLACASRQHRAPSRQHRIKGVRPVEL
jgi:hypothetical protein